MYLVQYTQDFGEYCGTFAGVDHIVVEYPSLLQDGTLLKAEERVAAGCRNKMAAVDGNFQLRHSDIYYKRR